MKKLVMIAAVVAAALSSALVSASAANAATHINPGAWSGNPLFPTTSTSLGGTVTSSSVSYPNGVSVTATTSGKTSIAGTDTLGLADSTDAMFTAPATTSTPTVNFFTNGTGCAVSGPCTDQGTITVTFSEPVLNPVLHLTSLSGWAGTWPGGPENYLNTTDSSLLHPKWTLTGSIPSGATLGAPSAGATNLATTATTIDVVDPMLSTHCDSIIDPPNSPTATSGCGSVPVRGVVSSLSFDIDLIYQIDKGQGWNGPVDSELPLGDVYGLAVSFDDVPATAATLTKEVCTVAAGCDDTVAAGTGGWASTHTVPSGGSAQWRLVATNAGAEDLVNLIIDDAVAPGCSRTVAVLAIGESTTATCTSAGLTAPVTNTATVSGTGAQTGQVATAEASASVAVTAPISVTPQTAVASPNGPVAAPLGPSAVLPETGAETSAAMWVVLLAGLGGTLLAADRVRGARVRRERA